MMQTVGIQWNSHNAIYVIADTSFGPECTYMCLCIIKTPKMWKTSHCVKQPASPVPTVPELYKIHTIKLTLLYHIHKIVRHLKWIQTLGIIFALSLIVLTFVNISQRGTKMRLIGLKYSKTHYHAYRKYTGTPELEIPPYSGHIVVVPTVLILEGFYCIQKLRYITRINHKEIYLVCNVVM